MVEEKDIKVGFPKEVWRELFPTSQIMRFQILPGLEIRRQD